MPQLPEKSPVTHPRQDGAALFMALVILLVLTLLGVFGMNMARLENLMAGNSQFMTTALNNAEYTLERGIEDVLALETAGTPYPAGAQYHDIGDAGVDPQNLDWSGFTYATVSLPDSDGDGNPDETGFYIIENAGLDNDEGEDESVSGVTNPMPGAIVQVFLVSAQSDSSRGAKRTVQSLVVTDPLAP
jgi:hypothetical protein